jgi:hypothetical protein
MVEPIRKKRLKRGSWFVLKQPDGR